MPERTPEPALDEPARRASRCWPIAGKITVAVVAVSVFIATGFAWSAKQWVNDKIRQVSALDLESSAIVDRDKQYGDENFLLVGSDTRAGADPADQVGDEVAVPGARSDTLMIAHIPADRSRVVVVSFPRDLEIDLPACEGWDAKSGDYTGQTNQPEQHVKINMAFQVGGPRCTTRVVQELTGISINHYLGIDFNGFRAMVDAVDGVEVCVERPVEDLYLGTVVDEPGPVKLTGDKALDFVRARHVNGDSTSDYGRIRRQQKFISALLRKAMSNGVLFDPGKLHDFIDAVAANTFGDGVGVDQLLTLAQSLHGLDAGRVTFATVPTTGETNGRGNEELRDDATAALFRAIIDGTPLPGEKPAEGGQQPPTNASGPPASGPPPAPSLQPAEVKLQVLNGTARDGLAGKSARELKQVGFNVVKVDNALQRIEHTVIKHGKVREAQARTVAAAVPGATLQLDPSMGTAVELVLGTDFDGQINQVPAAGAPDAAPAAPTSTPLPDDLATVNAADQTCA